MQPTISLYGPQQNRSASYNSEPLQPVVQGLPTSSAEFINQLYLAAPANSSAYQPCLTA